MLHPIRICYDYLVKNGKLQEDVSQLELIEHFIALDNILKIQNVASKKSALGWLFSKNAPKQIIKGIYIWGDVGRGKTMLMDLFFNECSIRQKRRVHFHSFMAEVHDKINDYRQQLKKNNQKIGDPIYPIADHLSHHIKLLCFDEFFVTDITDAMILGRLFERLFANRIIVVITSNAAPDNLYANGLNRQLFLPFINLIKKYTYRIELKAKADFRLEKLKKKQTYFSPITKQTDQALNQLWSDLTSLDKIYAPYTIKLKGRQLVVPAAKNGVARFHFDDLCNKPLGTADYLALTQHFHTLILERVPILKQEDANAVRRFINLIDTFYDNRIKLIISAADIPNKLYQAQYGNEITAFKRTISRLIEMQAEDYITQSNTPSFKRK